MVRGEAKALQGRAVVQQPGGVVRDRAFALENHALARGGGKDPVTVWVCVGVCCTTYTYIYILSIYICIPEHLDTHTHLASECFPPVRLTPRFSRLKRLGRTSPWECRPSTWKGKAKGACRAGLESTAPYSPCSAPCRLPLSLCMRGHFGCRTCFGSANVRAHSVQYHVL